MAVVAEFVACETLLIEAIICLSLLRLLPVRRKILRLYWAGAVIYISRACFYNIQAAVS